MKRTLILEENSNVIPLKDVSRNSYIGVKHMSSPDVIGFVSRTSHNSGDFIVLFSSDITNGNNFEPYRNSKLSSLLKDISNFFHVYVFDTPAELFLWVAENAKGY